MVLVGFIFATSEEFCSETKVQQENVLLQGQVSAVLHKINANIPAGMLKERRPGRLPPGMLKERQPSVPPPDKDTDEDLPAAVKGQAILEIVGALADLSNMLELLDGIDVFQSSDCEKVDASLAQIPPGMLKERRPGAPPPGMLKERRGGAPRKRSKEDRKRRRKKGKSKTKGRKGKARRGKSQGKTSSKLKRLKSENKDLVVKVAELELLMTKINGIKGKACGLAKNVDEVKEFIRKAEMHLEGAKSVIEGTKESEPEAESEPEEDGSSSSDSDGSSSSTGETSSSSSNADSSSTASSSS